MVNVRAAHGRRISSLLQFDLHLLLKVCLQQLAAVGCKASSADQHDKVMPQAASSSSSTASAAKSESMDSVLGGATSTDGQVDELSLFFSF